MRDREGEEEILVSAFYCMKCLHVRRRQMRHGELIRTATQTCEEVPIILHVGRDSDPVKDTAEERCHHDLRHRGTETDGDRMQTAFVGTESRLKLLRLCEQAACIAAQYGFCCV